MTFLHRQLLGRATAVPFALCMATCFAMTPIANAQARPSGGEPRPWISGTIGIGYERQHCTLCAQPSTIGGPTLSLAGGVSLPKNFGVGLAIYDMEQFSFEHSQNSRYVLALLQYSPAGSPLTLNFGGGRGHHSGEARYSNIGDGTAVALGVALRLPRSGAVASVLSANLLQSISGSTPLINSQLSSNKMVGYRPQLITFGLGLTLASHIDHANNSSARN